MTFIRRVKSFKSMKPYFASEDFIIGNIHTLIQSQWSFIFLFFFYFFSSFLLSTAREITSGPLYQLRNVTPPPQSHPSPSNGLSFDPDAPIELGMLTEFQERFHRWYNFEICISPVDFLFSGISDVPHYRGSFTLSIVRSFECSF